MRKQVCDVANSSFFCPPLKKTTILSVGVYYCKYCQDGPRLLAFGAKCRSCVRDGKGGGQTAFFSHIKDNEGNFVEKPIRGYCATCGCTGPLLSKHQCWPIGDGGQPRDFLPGEKLKAGQPLPLTESTCPDDFVAKRYNKIIVKKIESQTGNWSVFTTVNAWANDILETARNVNIGDVIRTASFVVNFQGRQRLQAQSTLRVTLATLLLEWMRNDWNGGFRIGGVAYESIGIDRN